MLNARKELGPNEVVKHTPPRVAIKLTNVTDSSTISGGDVAVRLSNQRLFLSVGSDPITYRVVGKGDRQFTSLSLPLLRSTAGGGIAESKLVQPWFGPNQWQALVIPGAESTFEPACTWKMTVSFTNGGAFEFVEQFKAVLSDAAAAKREGIPEPLPAYAP